MRRAVGLWLLLVAAAVVVQVVLGGVTRLTDSGLSITEWKPILGVIPPTNEEEWTVAFGKYQQLPQYVQLKSHLTLEGFKFIYFWEWFHRLWGRLLGVFFAVPCLVFWRRGALAGLGSKLAALFVLGGLQGALGWFMVKSGLSELVYVSHLRLAAHYVFAVLLLSALVWLGAGLTWPERVQPNAKLARVTSVLLGVMVVQLTWGAFMAGLKAALQAPSWPDINGAWIPSSFGSSSPWSDVQSVHFIHRTLAYGLLVAMGWWWWQTRSALKTERHVVLGLVVTQVVLGVLTLLNAPYAGRLLWFGAAHQLVGTLLFAAFVMSRRLLNSKDAT